MRRIYTSIDIGSNEIKVVTIENFNDRYNVLASVCEKSAGVKKGLIVDAALVSNAIKKAMQNLEAKLGTKVNKVIAIIPSNNLEIHLANGMIELEKEDEIITGKEIFACLQSSLQSNISKELEVVTVSPVEYRIDDERKVKNPLGLVGKKLEVKTIVTTVPKKNVYSVVSILQALNIEVMDVCTSSISDYYVSKTKELDAKVVAIVNIGKGKTNIGLFNKGAIIKDTIIPVGSSNIEDDICFTYKVEKEQAVNIKEKFAVSNRKYADSSEVFECKNRLEETISINQYKLAELIETRIVDILKNVKIEINNLTNREIGYIIITGGITSMTGFNAIVEDLFIKNVTVMNIGILGIRDNKYSSAFGNVKYFTSKLDLREKDYTMFEDEKINEILSTRKKAVPSSVLGKVFDKIFD